MTEIEHLVDTVRRAYAGEAWHGPSLAEILSGVTAMQAGVRCAKSHTIWELLLHITAWLDIPRRRLEGERLSDEELSWTDNWPPVPECTEENWQEALRTIGKAHKKFLASLAGFPEGCLENQVPGKDYSFQVMVHGVAQHLLYHAGQIALLKKTFE